MEETKSNLKSEVDESDSWTLVDNDDSDEGNLNVEPNEPSDSESLEVLEVEQAEPEENYSPEDNSNVGEKEDSCNDCTVNYCVSEDSVIHLASVQKVKKYVHHPSAYINMWLSIVMVIAVTTTLGLGIGHYLGSKRFIKARDMINHLKYENQLLEQELANAVGKQELCGNDLKYRDSIFGNLTLDKDENVCYADEDPFIKRNLKGHSLNMAMPILLHWYTHFNVNDKQNLLHSNNQDTPNRSFLSTKLVKGDGSMNVNYFPKLLKSSDERPQESQDFVSKLNNTLTYLRSLVKKWGKFRENLALQVRTENINIRVEDPIPKQLHNFETIPCDHIHVSETSSKNSSGNNNNSNNISVSSPNGNCRLKVSQCVLREENWINKEPKCKVLPKGQLFCSILFGKKHRNIPLDKNWQRNRKYVNKSEAQKITLKNKKVRRVKGGHLVNEGPSLDIKNTWLNEKKHEQSRNVKQKKVNFQKRSQFSRDQVENNAKMHKYSTSNAKKLSMKIEGEHFFKKGKKEKHENNKHKNSFKSEKVKDKREKAHQHKKYFEKQKHKKFQHESKELPKFFKKMSGRDKNMNSEKLLKNKEKRPALSGKKREHSERHKSVKNWNKHCDRSDKYYKGKPNSKHCLNQMQFENPSIQLKFDELENFHYKSEKNNYKNKNFSDNGNFKYGADKYHKKNNYQDWKEKRKVHRMNVHAMEVFKS